MNDILAYGAPNVAARLQAIRIPRQALRPNDAHIDILYCGSAISDLHIVRNDWGISVYHLVPGHSSSGAFARWALRCPSIEQVTWWQLAAWLTAA